MSSPPDRIIVLGAGLAGLACARELGPRALVIERESRVGGAARSFHRDGFTFDMTGHWLHLADADTERRVHALLGDELVRIRRRAAVCSRGVTTPYPFQANTYGRPPEVIADCVLGYFRAREQAARGEHAPPASFEDFIHQRLGDGIARHFMIPYNTKLWTVSPKEMDAAWCERFVPLPRPEDVVQGALRRRDAESQLGYNATLYYPRAGGIGRLAERLAEGLAAEVRCGVTAVRIDWRTRTLWTGAGDTLGYDALVSTAPLPDLVAMLVEPPEVVVAAARRLVAASVTYWDLGFARPNASGDAHWTYFPDPELPFYRAGSPSAALPVLAPPGSRSLYVEVSHRRGASVPATDADILRGLRAVGLVGQDEEPVVAERTTIDCAYVIPDHAYATSRKTIHEWLTGERIVAIGRYGSWTYDSMEGALKDGWAAGQRCRA